MWAMEECFMKELDYLLPDYLWAEIDKRELKDMTLDNVREEYEKTKEELEKAEMMRQIQFMRQRIDKLRNGYDDNFTL